MIGHSKQEMVQKMLEQQIVSGVMKKGSRLPSMRLLAEQYDCSTIVIVKAMRALEKKGLVRTRERSGSMVADATLPALKHFALYTDIRQSSMDRYYDDLLDMAGENHYLAAPIFANGAESLKTLLATSPQRIAIDLGADQHDYREIEEIVQEFDPVFVNRFEWHDQELPARGVLIDYEGTYAAALKYLQKQGHKRIVFVGHRQDPLPFKLRYLQAAAESNGVKFLSPEFDYCWHLDYDVNPERFQRLFFGKERPTAIFGASDILVFRVANLLESLAPAYRELVRIGCHDEVWSRIPGFEFSTWHFDFRDVFRRAMEQNRPKLEWSRPVFVKRQRQNIRY